MQLMKILLYAIRVILTLLKMYGIDTDAKSADDMFEPVAQTFKKIRDRVQKLGFILCASGDDTVTKAMALTKKYFVQLDKETSTSMESRDEDMTHDEMVKLPPGRQGQQPTLSARPDDPAARYRP